MSFTHLQVKSGYSFFNSTNTIEKLVKQAHLLEFKALALTDEEVLYGALQFYKTCIKYGMKPLIGMTIDITVMPEEVETCILLAKNNRGYQQLMKVSTLKQQSDQEMSLSTLKTYTQDLLCILPVNTSVLAKMLQKNSHEEAVFYTEKWHEIFKENDFYLGISSHHHTIDEQFIQSLKTFQQSTNISVAALGDVRYLKADDGPAYDCLQAIKHDQKWTTGNREYMYQTHHLRSVDEMNGLFGAIWPGILHETEAIAQKCNVTFDFETKHMPSFSVPNGQGAHAYLQALCDQKINEKFTNITAEINERLSYELHVIETMKFSDYFLIVADYIDYARKKNILVGPGRGSAAGSIVAYILGITEVNPLAYGLLFERFLNPARVTMPDIDVDFSDQRRDEVIDYVRRKYGNNHVSQIITFGTFGARSLLRELFKTMDIDQRDAAFILGKIPVSANKNIATYVRESQDLIDYIKQSPKLRLLFTVASKLEGLPRHLSTHAAGVVITEQPLTDYIPLTKGANGYHLTQFPMNDLEAIGLLKMDFLGLRNLTILEQVVRSIRLGTNKHFTLHTLPEGDLKTFKLLQKGRTNGIFQLESAGMKRVLTQLKPTTFEDIVAVNALYRPGPMDYIPTYIQRKHGNEDITYLHPDIEPILADTYGVLIYQEQIMQIAHTIAGFTFGEADILRRAVSKKEPPLIKEQEDAFIKGCVHKGYEQKIAAELFSWIVKFSNYGFNKSHAVAYSKISYQLAYLKANYPLDFFTALLNETGNQGEKIKQYIKEAKKQQIQILSPSINKSYGKYVVEQGNIRMGLYAIKGIGHQPVQEIIRQRKERPFTNLFDFCMRVSLKIVQRKTLELLILSGAFDETYSNRASLLASLDQAIDQGDLFGGLVHQPSLLPEKYGIEERYTEIDDFSQMKKLADEKELLGMYLSSHPLKVYRKKLQVNGYVSFQDALKMQGKNNVSSAAVIHSIRKIRTKRGDPMAFITLGDEYSDMDAVVFPELYRSENRWLAEEKVIFITGKITKRNNQLQWLLSSIEQFSEEKMIINEQRLFIKLTEIDHQKSLNHMREIAEEYPGNTAVIIFDDKNKRTFQLAGNYHLHVSDRCLLALKTFFGETNVILES